MSSTWQTINEKYEAHLKEKGVKKMSQTSGLGQALACLVENIGVPVKIETIREYVQNNGVVLPGGGDSLQVRHLALQNGYNMLKGGDTNPITGIKVPRSNFVLLDLETPHPGYIPKRRSSPMSDDGWIQIMDRYGNCCVNCGSQNGQSMRWNPLRITVLQKGHMDPRKYLSLDNVIPQCAICNQQYKNKAVFNERGFVVAFNPDGFVA
jgi:hypothetical protein